MVPSFLRKREAEKNLYDTDTLYRNLDNYLNRLERELERTIGRAVIEYSTKYVVPHLLGYLLQKIDTYIVGGENVISRIDRAKNEIEGILGKYRGRTDLGPNEIERIITSLYSITRLKEMRQSLYYRVLGMKIFKDVLSNVYDKVRRGERVTWSEVSASLIGEALKKAGEGIINYFLVRIFPIPQPQSTYQSEKRLSKIAVFLIGLTIPLFVLHVLNVSTKGMFFATPIASVSSLFLSFLLLFVAFYYWMKQKQ
jgi:hypothetical protein